MLDFLTFLATGLGKTLLVLSFFGLIILFLRVLYGPKGFLRDPAWDKKPEIHNDLQETSTEEKTNKKQ